MSQANTVEVKHDKIALDKQSCSTYPVINGLVDTSNELFEFMPTDYKLIDEDNLYRFFELKSTSL